MCIKLAQCRHISRLVECELSQPLSRWWIVSAWCDGRRVQFTDISKNILLYFQWKFKTDEVCPGWDLYPVVFDWSRRCVRPYVVDRLIRSTDFFLFHKIFLGFLTTAVRSCFFFCLRIFGTDSWITIFFVFSCHFQWIAGQWEHCSTTCGLHGVQYRELYCVPQAVLNKMLFQNNGTIIDDPWKHMVNPNKCSGITPVMKRPCNQFPCFSYWTYGEWSQVRSHYV